MGPLFYLYELMFRRWPVAWASSKAESASSTLPSLAAMLIRWWTVFCRSPLPPCIRQQARVWAPREAEGESLAAFFVPSSAAAVL